MTLSNAGNDAVHKCNVEPRSSYPSLYKWIYHAAILQFLNISGRCYSGGFAVDWRNIVPGRRRKSNKSNRLMTEWGQFIVSANPTDDGN
ncbi:Uncharacterized protein HZ326_24588 [Fusarium oxysporum f. sp. albedinis]|nr:Uncharacterized protein HZ326_24588 [Fusarium oxysporum f. sp. albedinis]